MIYLTHEYLTLIVLILFTTLTAQGGILMLKIICYVGSGLRQLHSAVWADVNMELLRVGSVCSRNNHILIKHSDYLDIENAYYKVGQWAVPNDKF